MQSHQQNQEGNSNSWNCNNGTNNNINHHHAGNGLSMEEIQRNNNMLMINQMLLQQAHQSFTGGLSDNQSQDQPSQMVLQQQLQLQQFGQDKDQEPQQQEESLTNLGALFGLANRQQTMGKLDAFSNTTNGLEGKNHDLFFENLSEALEPNPCFPPSIVDKEQDNMVAPASSSVHETLATALQFADPDDFQKASFGNERNDTSPLLQHLQQGQHHNMIFSVPDDRAVQVFQSQQPQPQPNGAITVPSINKIPLPDGLNVQAFDGTSNRFRHYQADQWTIMLEGLLDFKRRHGHCNVPHTSKALPALGRWVKRQRYQYKLMIEGKKESTMTPERAQVLEHVGFVWDAHGSTWQRRFQELYSFYSQNGHCNIPSNFPSNPQLSTWVKFQRRQCKAMMNGRQRNNRAGRGPTNQSLTEARIRALNEIGFQWELRRSRTTPNV